VVRERIALLAKSRVTSRIPEWHDPCLSVFGRRKRPTNNDGEDAMSISHRRAQGGDLSKRTLAVVMAGGNGTRLGALTRWDCKPALPFGGQYRNIDFPLSNCMNSGVRQVAILTQYKAHTLIQHVTQGWSFLRAELNEYVQLWPAQQRKGQRWYDGTADAVYQNIDLIMERAPAYVLVLAGDHVYKMDYRPMIETHAASGADVTVGCVEVPLEEAGSFGVMGVDVHGWVEEFKEKPDRPKAVPGRPNVALGSMGIYVFNRDFLFEALIDDASNPSSGHDFGRNLLPGMVRDRRVRAHAFRDESGRQAYWRDVGTVDSYWQANMDLLEVDADLDLHDEQWPIWTHQPSRAPTRFSGGGTAMRSIVAAGAEVSGCVDRSVLFVETSIGAGSTIAASLVLPKARIGRNCRLRNVIVDSACEVPDGTVIGEDTVGDAVRYDVSAGGIVLVTQQRLHPKASVETVAPRGLKRVAA
jgi:glucose-1-phosphate adenylyltransferase